MFLLLFSRSTILLFQCSSLSYRNLYNQNSTTEGQVKGSFAAPPLGSQLTISQFPYSRDQKSRFQPPLPNGPPPAQHAAQQNKPSLFKTRLCALFVHGKCTHGASCNFAHSTKELQGAPDLRKTSLCVEFMQTGQCRRRDECRFAHGYGELRHTAEVYKTSLCTFWEYNNCQYGNFCRHAHGLKELRSVEENRRRFNSTMNDSNQYPPSTNAPYCDRTYESGGDRTSTIPAGRAKQFEPPQYADFKTFAALDTGFANEFSVDGSAPPSLEITAISESPGPIGPAIEPVNRCLPCPPPVKQPGGEATPITRESTLTEVVSLPFVSQGSTWGWNTFDAAAGWDSPRLLAKRNDRAGLAKVYTATQRCSETCSVCKKSTTSYIVVPSGLTQNIAHKTCLSLELLTFCIEFSILHNKFTCRSSVRLCGLLLQLKQSPVCVAPVSSYVNVLAS
jgi:hypothetical protein